MTSQSTRTSMIAACLVVALPFVSAPAWGIDCTAGGGCLGPNHPAMYDSDANGTPDTPIPVTFAETPGAGGFVGGFAIDSPWHCDPLSTNNQITGGRAVGDRYAGFERTNGVSTQQMQLNTGAAVDGIPSVTSAAFTETRPTPLTTATATLYFSANHIVVDGLRRGSPFYVGTDIVFTGGGNYVSVPWRWDQVGQLFNTGNGCGPSGGTRWPQISVPVARTAGGDPVIALDFTGGPGDVPNDAPDAQFFV
jgi:hypothetical protein